MVLDASALLALMQREPGWQIVEEALGDCVLSAVNASEVIAKLCERGISATLADDAVRGLVADVADFDLSQAVEAGAMRLQTRAAGLSLGDRACLALARSRGAPAITADRSWSALDIGVDIRVIRT